MLKKELVSKFSGAVLAPTDLSEFSDSEVLAFAVGWAYEWLRYLGKPFKGTFYVPINAKEVKWEKLTDLLLHLFTKANYKVSFYNFALKNLLSYCFLNLHGKKGRLSTDEEIALSVGLTFYKNKEGERIETS